MKYLSLKLVQRGRVAIVFLISSLILINFSYGQVKIWPGGTTVVGSSSTSGANSKFHVVGNSTFSSSNTAPTSAAYIRGLNIHSTANEPDFTWWGDDKTGFFHPTGNQTIGIAIVGVEAMRVNSSKNLLIGQTVNNAGNQRLQVTNSATNGSALQLTILNHVADFAYCQVNNVNKTTSKAFEVQLSGVAKYYIRGDGTTVFLSDRNLKTEIQSLENSIDKLSQIKCYSYRFIDEISSGNAQRKIGLMAQELEDILPDLVFTDDNGVKGIDYISLIPYLIEGIQKQEIKINDLKDQLDECCNTSELRTKKSSVHTSEKASELVSTNSEAILEQNQPNPFNKESRIACFIPQDASSASILILDLNGRMLKSYKINDKGNVQIKIQANEFQAGMYHYSLIVDNKEIDTKKMIITQ